MQQTLPLIKIDPEGMKRTVIEAIEKYNDQISQKVENELKQVIEKFDFGKMITGITNEVIQEMLVHYLKYGSGHALLEATIRDELDKMLKSNIGLK